MASGKQAFGNRNLQGPGDFSLDHMNIINSAGEKVSIKDHGWMSISLTEDIFEPAIMGVIDIIDSVNLPQNLNLIGNEKIELGFSAPSLEPIIFTGSITKVTESIDTSDSSKGYSLEIISTEAVTSLLQKVRKSYTAKSHSDIAKLIYSRYLGSRKAFRVEDTLNTTSIAIPGWNPFDAIKSLADRSQSANPKYQNGSYLFYENCGNGDDNGGFSFRSLESLWDGATPLVHYTNQVKNTEMGNPADFTSVNWYAERARMDSIDNISGGMYASKVNTHDLVKRKTYTKTYNYIKKFGETTHSNKNAQPLTNNELYVNSPESYEIYMPKQYQSHGEGFDHDTTLPEHTAMNRTSVAQQLNNQVLDISIPGDSERRVGDVVSFAKPSDESVSGDGPPLDRFISGNYLVTAVTHKIASTPEQYETVMELSKESLVR